jgi:flagellar hook assembly protein FlgD
MIRVRIYDTAGRLVRRLAANEPSSSTGTIIWNGLDDNSNRVRIGMYIILFEALDNFGGTVRTMKDVAVVARKL